VRVGGMALGPDRTRLAVPVFRGGLPSVARPFAMGCLWACSVVWDRMIGAQRREAAGSAPSAPGEGRGGPELAIGPGKGA
jgi:hypothetical protein